MKNIEVTLEEIKSLVSSKDTVEFKHKGDTYKVYGVSPNTYNVAKDLKGLDAILFTEDDRPFKLYFRAKEFKSPEVQRDVLANYIVKRTSNAIDSKSGDSTKVYIHLAAHENQVIDGVSVPIATSTFILKSELENLPKYSKEGRFTDLAYLMFPVEHCIAGKTTFTHEHLGECYHQKTADYVAMSPLVFDEDTGLNMLMNIHKRMSIRANIIKTQNEMIEFANE